MTARGTFKSVAKEILVGRNLKKTLLRAGIIALLAVLVFKFILIPIKNQTEAMEPSLEQGKLVWVSPIPYWNSMPERGDIVAIKLTGGSVVYLSRVIGLPGEIISLTDNQLFVNDETPVGLPLQIGDEILQSGYQSKVIEDDEVFVAGDWRNGPLETMHRMGSFGRVKKSQILGKVMF